ncbi:MAG: MFS transporter [Spirochaetales bacterium]|nr:MFS transporter [Spirochaetales bacterium]
MITKIKEVIAEYPGKFWLLVGSSFVDSLGRTILFPFFTLYITSRFVVGMTEAGALLAIFSVTGMIGSMIGGALADKIGRKGMVIAGLVLSAVSNLSMGFIGNLLVFYLMAVLVGLLSNIGGPARQAMVVDLLPEEKRAEGFGVLRVINNLAWVVGPSIGGFLAARSYLNLFIADAVLSLATALIILKFIPETKPQNLEEKGGVSFWETLKGYREVARNKTFMIFLVVMTLMVLVYIQLYSTFSIYIRDFHGITEKGYGLLMSFNAGIVVIFQFWVSRKIRNRSPFLMMALGTACYLIGYTAFGIVHGYVFLLLAVTVITIGEMITVPVQQALVADFAPEDMRGRYMAVFGVSWSIPSMIGPWAAGMILDNYDPNLVWYLCGIISALALAGFLGLYFRTRKEKAFASNEEAART